MANDDAKLMREIKNFITFTIQEENKKQLKLIKKELKERNLEIIKALDIGTKLDDLSDEMKIIGKSNESMKDLLKKSAKPIIRQIQ